VGKLAAGAWTSYRGLMELGEIAAEQVYSLYVEKAGTLWVAAKGGAAAFNGASWKLYNKNNTTAIQSRFVYAVMTDKDGDIWFGTQKGVSEMVPVKDDE
jgi:ligand-binding sensor domain-containing protein